MNRLVMALVAVGLSCGVSAAVRTADQEAEYAALKKESAALLSKADGALARIAVQEKVLKLPLTTAERVAALREIGSVYSGPLGKAEEGRVRFREAIKLVEADLKGHQGAERVKDLEMLELLWRGGLLQKKEADEVSEKILAAYYEDLKTLTGVNALIRRGDVRKYLLRMNRGLESDKSRAWDADTVAYVKDWVKTFDGLSDEEWLKKLGVSNINLAYGFLRVSEDGRRFALEKIADRIYGYKGTDKSFPDAQKRLVNASTGLASSSQAEDLRRRTATYYRTAGNLEACGEALYKINGDLEGARKAFAEAADTPKVLEWRAMLSEEPAHAWQLAYAREEFTNWVTKISGKTPDMSKVVLGTPESDPEAAAFAKRHVADFAKLKGNDGFIIAEEGGFLWWGEKKLYIVAAKTKGVLNGVYRFLERNSDIIWVREIESEDGFGTVYTKNPDFRNSISYLCDVPAYRKRYWTCGPYKEAQRWQARLLNNFGGSDPKPYYSWVYRNYSTYGDPDEMEVGLSLGMLLKYAESDPDVLSLVGGKRSTYHDCQLCFMNPKTVELFAKEAIALLESVPRRANRVFYCLGDNWSYCECEKYCKQPIALPDGTVVRPDEKRFRSTQYALFMNAVHERLLKKFPNLEPRYYSYLICATPPAVKPCAGGGTYCPYVKSHKKPVYDDAVNAGWHRNAEGFKAAGIPVWGLYEYYLCSTTPNFYHATMEVMQKDLAYYGAPLKEVYLDAGGSDGYNGLEANGKGANYEASAIEFYVASRLMWDPKTDVKAARREFCRRAYHGAAEIMSDYYEKLAENYNDDPAGCYWNDDPIIAAKHYVVEKDLASWLRETLAKAESAATDPRSKELVRRHRIHMEWLVREAEKMPRRLTLVVGKDWTEVGPLTKIGEPNTPSDGKTKMWVKNDQKTLFFKFEVQNEDWVKRYNDFKAAGKVGTSQDDKIPFDWNRGCELYLDGDRAAGGSYYHLCMMLNERLHTGYGASPATEPVTWSGTIEPIKGGIRGIVALPLKSFGIDISTGNKVGVQFLVNGSSWNGGQWHSPASFQTLQLNME